MLAAGAALCVAAGLWTAERDGSRAVPATADKGKSGPSSEEGAPETAGSRGNAFASAKRVALTFDDGPHPVYTPKLLELLEQEQVPATFFLLGQNVEAYPEVVEEIAGKGHLIGNHTYHHVEITSLSEEQACLEIDETSRLIEELTGSGTEYVRPPFGTWNEGLEDRLDLIPVMWTVDTLDWTTENVDWIVERTMADAGENAVILMHDSYESTVRAVERLIPLLRSEGFEFVTVDRVIMD